MSTHRLHLSDTLRLPIEAVTEKLGFLGRTGSGKTYAAQKLAEEMHAAGAQFVVLDPVGVWWGLRLAGNGKDAGLPIPVFGGLHGDVPLEPTSGGLIADLIVDRAISCVIDVSQFEHDSDKAKFARAFADRFFFRKKASPSAVHIFLEECQEFIPQSPASNETHMLHAFVRLFKIGRNFGIGGSLITQRPQEVSKKVLNLIECLFCFQLTGPHERKAVDTWIADKGIDEDIRGELPKLKVGTAHAWSPAWLGVSEKVAVATKQTFDASSTPKVGKRAEVRALSPIDMEALRTEMAATIERAKADDPKELHQRIRTLEVELKKHKAHPTEVDGVPRRVYDVASLGWEKEKSAREKTEAECCILRAAVDQAMAELERFRGAMDGISAGLLVGKQKSDAVGARTHSPTEKIAAGLRASKPTNYIKGGRLDIAKIADDVEAMDHAPDAKRYIEARDTPGRGKIMLNAGITARQQRFLDAAATLSTLDAEVTRETVAGWLGIHPRGGSVGEELKALVEAGLVTIERGTIAVTTRGHQSANPMDPSKAIDSAKAGLSTRQRKFFELIETAYPGTITREAIAEECNIHPRGGSLGEDLGRLVKRGLVENNRGAYKLRAFLVAR